MNDLNAFRQFAEQTIAGHGAESLQELVDIWDMEHPTTELHSVNSKAIQAAIRDMENGEVGQPAKQVLRELRAELTERRSP